VVGQVSQNLYQAMTRSTPKDEQAEALSQALFEKFGEIVRSEIKETHAVDDSEQWSIALLEEVKINYVKQLSVEDVDRLLEENYRLYNLTQTRS
jgi:hypothetical protein